MRKINVVFCLVILMVNSMVLGSCSNDKPDMPLPKVTKVTGIEIEHLPTKVEYYVAEEFDVAGLTLKKTYSDGSSKIVPVNKEQVTGFSSATVNADLVLEVKEAEFVVSFSVKIIENKIGLVKLELEHLPTKVEYYVAEEFDVAGLTLKETYSDGSSKIVPVNKEQVTGFSSATVNAKLVLEVKEAEFVVSFSVKIIENKIKSIELTHQPSKTIYTLGETLSLQGAVIEVVYDNGTKKDITSISSDMVKGFDSSKPSPQLSLQISVDSKEVSFNVTILPFKVVNNEITSSVISDITSLTIPDGVTSIKDATFFNNKTIEEVIFPASVTSIGDNAFGLCVNLKRVDLSKTSISTLPSGIFDQSGLVTILLPPTLKTVGSNSFSNTKALKELTLPDGVQQIGTTAFSGSGLETITIPNTVSNMARSFYNCTQLKTIKTFGSKIATDFNRFATIQGECFNHCPNIEIMEIPESITNIGISVLGVCKVKTLILPQNVKNLEHNAFGNASSLEEITLESTTKVEASSYPVPSTIKAIKVPSTLVDAYKQDQHWKAFADKIVAM